MNYLKRFAAAHERLKKKIHGTRIPLGPAGRFGMGCVYVSTPIIIGYFIMEYCADVAQKNHELTIAKVDATKDMYCARGLRSVKWPWLCK